MTTNSFNSLSTEGADVVTKQQSLVGGGRPSSRCIGRYT